MSDTKLNAIHRAPKQQLVITLDDWGGGEEQAWVAPSRIVTFKAAVTLALRRCLRLTAIKCATSVADILHEQADRWLAEQDSQKMGGIFLVMIGN